MGASDPCAYSTRSTAGRERNLEDLRDQLHAYGFEGKSWIRGMRRIPNRAILRRLLTNLKLAYVKRGDYARALAAVDRILILDPSANEELRDQGTLAGQAGQYRKGIAALRAYLRAVPEASDKETIETQLESFRYWDSRRN